MTKHTTNLDVQLLRVCTDQGRQKKLGVRKGSGKGQGKRNTHSYANASVSQLETIQLPQAHIVLGKSECCPKVITRGVPPLFSLQPSKPSMGC